MSPGVSIPANPDNAVVWMVSVSLPISNSSSTSFSSHFDLISIGISVTFMFHSFLSSLVKDSITCLSVLFDFHSVLHRVSKVYRFSFCLSLSLDCLVFWLGLVGSFVFQNPTEFYVSHFPERILGCAYSICSYGQITIFCTIPSGSPSQPIVSTPTLFLH